MSVIDVLTQLERGKISSREYTQEAIGRLKASSGLGAILHFDEEKALAAADAADAARTHKVGGRLCGLPILVKDNINTEDLPTSGGTPALMGNRTPEDAGVMSRLREDGAFPLAKTNLHELALGITSNNAAAGPVRNPHDAELIAGGSSGGTAAAVAAGILPVGLGTDTGGSCRIPAALCGVVGFRPTTGRYPSHGIVPISHTRDTAGIIGSEVNDICEIAKTVTARGLLECDKVSIRDVTIGIPRPRFFDNLEPYVARVIEEQIETLSRAGARIREVDFEGIWSHNDAFSFTVVLYEVMRDLPDYLRTYAPKVSFEALLEQIASPDVAGLLRSQLGDGAVPEEAYKIAMQHHRPRMEAIYEDLFSLENLDAVLFPTTPLTARPVGHDETVELNGVQVPTFPTYIRNADLGSNIGVPGLSIPCPVGDGLPVGLEIDGLKGDDPHLLTVGKEIERVLKG